MDIVVTTPKTKMREAAQEAEDCIADGQGFYFRRFARLPKALRVGDRVYYVENGFVRGFALVTELRYEEHDRVCETTGRWFSPGAYIFMDATTWKWIEPVPMGGFQGWRWRYATAQWRKRDIIGDWRTPRSVSVQAEREQEPHHEDHEDTKKGNADDQGSGS